MGGIHLYNHKRPHTALGMATPQEMHERAVNLRK